MEPVKCRICGGGASFLWEKDGRKAYKCCRCGFIFVHPLPTEALQDDFSHAKHLLSIQDHFRSEYNRFLERIESMIPRGKLLDVGCNIGLSLVVARDRGWSPLGVELSPEAARYGREEFGVKIIETPLEKAGFYDGEFDTVVMYHALEHVLHPLRLLLAVGKILRPGGILYVSVPNHGGISAFFLRENWGVHKDHVSFFDRGSLKEALIRAGMAPACITSYLGAVAAESKPRWVVPFLDRISNVLCFSLSLESWSRKPAIARPFSDAAR